MQFLRISPKKFIYVITLCLCIFFLIFNLFPVKSLVLIDLDLKKTITFKNNLFCKNKSDDIYNEICLKITNYALPINENELELINKEKNSYETNLKNFLDLNILENKNSSIYPKIVLSNRRFTTRYAFYMDYKFVNDVLYVLDNTFSFNIESKIEDDIKLKFLNDVNSILAKDIILDTEDGKFIEYLAKKNMNMSKPKIIEKLSEIYSLLEPTNMISGDIQIMEEGNFMFNFYFRTIFKFILSFIISYFTISLYYSLRKI